MASVVFIIRVPSEAQDDDQRSGKEESTSTDTEKKEQPNSEESSENIQNHTGLSQVEEQSQETKSAINKPTEPETPQGDKLLFESPQSIVEILQNVLKALKIQGASWQITEDKQFHQVMFIEDAGERVEEVLHKLTDAGIGLRPKSSISVIPTSVHIKPYKKPDNTSSFTYGSDQIPTEEESQSLLGGEKESTKDVFIKSIKSKLIVEQVIEGVRLQTRLTFDFVMFTALASLIAAVGLVEDNSVVLVASMLVSPLMGPILGGTFGNVVKNKELRNIGLKTEICGLIISVFVGFLFGFICGPFGLDGASWSCTIDTWPTKEMSSRGMLRSLWVGVLIALPSGAGVALSVLGGNHGSLVGVAISASLLPPAVNSGMLFAYSIISSIKHPTVLDHLQIINGSLNTCQETGCPSLKGNNYLPMYSCHMGKEAAIMAIISFVLTIVNIICILITATLVLKLKEVTPRASSTNATQTFWTKDVKVAKEAYQTLQGIEATNLKTMFLKELKEASASNNESQNTIQKEIELLNIIQEVEEGEQFQSIVRRTPQGGKHVNQFSRNLKKQISNDTDERIEENARTQYHLLTLHTQYSQNPKNADHPHHIKTLFETVPEQEPQKGRNFVVTDIENPHHTSVVRVRPPTEDSEKYSVLTESGV